MFYRRFSVEFLKGLHKHREVHKRNLENDISNAEQPKTVINLFYIYYETPGVNG